ncbi:uncharacterized protein LOC113325072 [Papaver somniferum]|uniref:uncharacterized protein LOC113325072 n=1 Tax=Papaver somniferum TaxID=3469 RepID=UPI000E6FBE71|nr:uncharacterized protein LOC113325072 [Papaver somniferum]
MSESDQSSPNSPVHNSNQTNNNNSRILDPYVIHPSDNPATILFSPLLQVDNYGSWVRGITKALNSKGKLGFFDGSLTPPEDDLTHRCWKHCDDLVGSWILNSVHPDIRASSIASIKQEFMPVSLYYTKIKTLWDQYDSLVASTEACICGDEKHMLERLERDRAIEFLQGIHDRFSNLRSQILTMEPFPTALRIFNLVKQEEEQQHIIVSPLPTVDVASLSSNRYFPSTSRAPVSHNKRQSPHCDYCNRHGHVRDKCYRLHGFPTTNNSLPPSNNKLQITAADTAVPADTSVVQQALPTLSADQYARLLTLINHAPESAQIEPRADFAGLCHETSDWSG